MILFTLVNLFFLAEASDRLCCRYRCEPGSADCAPWCSTENTCTIKNGTAFVTDPGCEVVLDSKKDDDGVESKKECLNTNFKSRRSFDSLPFYLQPYVYKTELVHISFTGIDFRYQYNAFKKLRFRLKNLDRDVCPEYLEMLETSHCNPRCVEIDRSRSVPVPGLVENLPFLSYDCEVGFYISEQRSEKSSYRNWIRPTGGHDYLLSVCAELDDTRAKTCGEYTFQMPSPNDLNLTSEHSVVVLVDKQEFDNKDQIVIYVPTTQSADTYKISLLVVSENKTTREIYSQTEPIPLGVGRVMRINVDHNIPSGRYQVAVTGIRGGVLVGEPSYSAYLVRPNYGDHTLVIITAILAIILLVGLILGIYKRWQQVAEEAAIEPSLLVEAGRIEPRPVLVITSIVDNDHAQIVKDLCVYLKDWCGVGATFYPLDDESGIHCGQMDPWKWAQNSYEKVKEKGTLIFVAAPNPGLSPSNPLYKGMQETQAFLATQDLRALAQEGRVLVVRLPYSDLKTLPTEVPQHLVSAAIHIPKHMNIFLSRLLQVRKKTLCNQFPISLVQPVILPQDMSRQGGPEIIHRIRELTVKEHSWRLDQAALGHNTVIDRLLRSPQEGGALKQGAKASYMEAEKGGAEAAEDKLLLLEGRTVLDIRLEGTVQSVADMADRDKTTTDEV